MLRQTIDILMIEPGFKPCKVSVFSDYESLQILISPCLSFLSEVEYLMVEDDVVLFYNKEGALLGLEGNRRVGNTIIAGTFFVAGVKNGNLTSLTKEKTKKYRKRFAKIESYTDKEVSKSYWNPWIYAIDDCMLYCD